MAVDSWTQTEWETFYRRRDKRPGSPTYLQQVSGYGKELFLLQGDPPDHLELFRQRWAAITAQLPIQTTDTVLVIGCAFGYLVAAAREAGFTETYGVDNSPYVETEKSVEADPGVIICNADIRGPQILNELRAATGYRRFDWLITEDVVACYSVAEVQSLQGAIEAILNPGQDGRHILHYTSIMRDIGGDSAFTWQTLEQWAAVIPTHNWMAHGDYQFIASTLTGT